ncbi:hypothetical protein PAMA_018058 [Pampus argenteus]
MWRDSQCRDRLSTEKLRRAQRRPPSPWVPEVFTDRRDGDGVENERRAAGMSTLEDAASASSSSPVERSGNTNTHFYSRKKKKKKKKKKTPDRYFGFEELRTRVCTPPSSTQMTVSPITHGPLSSSQSPRCALHSAVVAAAHGAQTGDQEGSSELGR